MPDFRAYVGVASDGYCWVESRHPKGTQLYDDHTRLHWLEDIPPKTAIDSLGKHCRHYDPFVDEPALYRIFARTPPTQEAILAFANQYGDLGDLTASKKGEGTTLNDWKTAIYIIANDIARIEELSQPKLSRKLRSEVNGELAATLNEFLGVTPLYLAAEPSGSSIRFDFMVYELEHAMRLQLVEALAKKKQYRDCELCDKPFELSPQINRSDRLFCSDNCRVKAYQRRKKKVIDLRKGGKSLSEIAKSTNTQFATVKDWTKDIEKGTK